MEIKDLFNLSASTIEKLNAVMESSTCNHEESMNSNSWNDCMSCRGGACTTGFGGD